MVDPSTIIRWVREEPTIALDTETTGLDWRKNKVIGYAFALPYPTSSFIPSAYVPVRHTGGGNIGNAESFERQLAKEMEHRPPDWRTVCHNAVFDAQMCLNHGVSLGRRLFCTMNSQALLDEFTPSFSLDSLAKQYGVEQKLGDEIQRYLFRNFGAQPSLFPDDRVDERGLMQHFHRLSGTDPKVQDYAKGDVISTVGIYLKQDLEINRRGLQSIVQMENELLWTLVGMERRGMAVDLEALESLEASVKSRVTECMREFPQGFNPNSRVWLARYLKSRGLGESEFRTPEGKVSYAQDMLSKFDAGRKVLDLRKWSNLISTFVKPLKTTHVFEGAINPKWHSNRNGGHGTISGRLSCSGPNLQQVPKRDKERAKMFRSVFVPRPGYTLMEDDWSQCEPRLFAHYSMDENLVQGYRSDPPRDVHTQVAEMLNVGRQFGKMLNMGIFNGMSGAALAKHLGISYQEACDYVAGWDRLFPGVSALRKQASSILRNRGYIRTVLGRQCHSEAPQFAYKAVSKLIQGSNADIMKLKLVQLDKYYESLPEPRPYLLATIHDAAISEVPTTDECHPMLHRAREIMLDVGPPIDLSVPFAIDRSFGRTWSEASFPEGA